MKFQLTVLTILSGVFVSVAQVPLTAPDFDQRVDTIRTVNINEIVISATKTEDTRMRVSQQLDVIPSAQIRLQNPQTTADLVQNSGSVFVQKSQAGGGSPVIRGFEASRVVLVIDGVRQNNLIYRSGHLQNIVSTDPFILERVEVLYGPSSTMYGSDALGGVVHLFTKQPRFSPNDKLLLKANAGVRYATVNNEKTVHADVNVGGKIWASLSSFTVSVYGDTRMGKRAGVLDSVWGKRYHYVERINGRDSLVTNPDPFVQVGSGYRQYDLLQKISFRPTARMLHTLNAQYSTSTDVPRYDRLTDPHPTNVLDYADWYYGPQERLMVAYDFRSFSDSAFFNRVSGGVSFQDVRESRHTRRFNRPFLTRRYEDVSIVGYDFDLSHRSGAQDFRIGLEGQLNYLKSTAYGLNVNVDTIARASTRYPDGANSQETWALYLTHTWNIGKKFVLNDGIRIEWIRLYSQFRDTTFFPFPFREVNQTNIPVSGNIGLNFLPNPRLKIGGLISTGFRSPNVDDLSKVFDSGSGILIVPNPNVKPEQTVNFELNVTKFFGDFLRWENVAFYTIFSDAIVVDRFTFNGEPTVEFGNDTSDVYAAQNKRSAFITGFNSNLQADITRFVAVSGTISYTYGRVQTDTTEVPLDHIPPVFGRVGVRYHDRVLNAEAYVLFNGWKRIKDYYLNGEDNERYATPLGMPSWYTLNVKASYNATKNITLQTGVENILDLNYRTFASGIHAPGRNIFAALRLSI